MPKHCNTPGWEGLLSIWGGIGHKLMVFNAKYLISSLNYKSSHLIHYGKQSLTSVFWSIYYEHIFDNSLRALVIHAIDQHTDEFHL